MALTRPFWAIDSRIRDQLVNYAPLLSLLPASKVQAWDRLVDIRRNFEEATLSGKRIIIMPNGIEIDPAFSSGSVRFKLHYEICLFSGKMLLVEIRQMEWLVCCAMIRLWKDLDATNAPGIHEITNPLVIEAFKIGGAQQDKLPLDLPEEWESVMELTVIADGSTDAIAAIVDP